jgi:hypothetical protein
MLLLPLLAGDDRGLPDHPVLGAPWWLGVGLAIAAAVALAYGALPRLRGSGGRARPTAADVMLLGVFPLYLLYLGNGVLLSAPDNLPNRYLPSLILKRGTLDLSDLPPFRSREQWNYATLWIGARTLSSFPMGTAFLAVPYTAAALAASGGATSDARVARWEKHFAALLGAASAGLLFAALRRFGDGPAAAATAVFALATPVVTYVSQGMWSASGEVFCIVAALALVVPRPDSGRATAAAGAVLGLATLCRATALIPVVAVGAALGWRGRGRVRPYWVAAAVALALVAGCLQLWYGHPLGGHGIINARSELYGRDLPAGALGLLLSPSRGALLFFPYLLLTPLAWRRSAGDPELRRWVGVALGVSIATWALAASYARWWGGWSIGPRLLTEASPFFALLTLPLWRSWRELRPALRAAALASVALAGATQLRGAYAPDAFNWNAVVDVDANPRALWSLRNGQLAAIWWPGWRYRLDAREAAAVDSPAGEARRWRRIDLAAGANARYDADPFDANASPWTWPRFGRIEPRVLNRPRARFHFGPRGVPNAVRVGPGEPSAEIETPAVVAGHLHALLTAQWSGDLEARTEIAELRVRYADGSAERLPLRLNREVFPYVGSPREHLLPAERIYLGEPDRRDALVRSDLTLSGGEPVVSVQILDAGTGARTVLLALTLEAPASLDPAAQEG